MEKTCETMLSVPFLLQHCSLNYIALSNLALSVGSNRSFPWKAVPYSKSSHTWIFFIWNIIIFPIPMEYLFHISSLCLISSHCSYLCPYTQALPPSHPNVHNNSFGIVSFTRLGIQIVCEVAHKVRIVMPKDVLGPNHPDGLKVGIKLCRSVQWMKNELSITSN